MGATPANQLRVFANSCGPCALYNSYMYGGKKWQKIISNIPREGSREKIRYIVRNYASRPSHYYQNSRRWNARTGINAKDLTDVANEVIHGHWLPKLSHQTFFQKPREKNTELLKRIHRNLKHSLKKKLPPIATLQRYVARKSKHGRFHWILIQSHFVSIVSLPKKITADTKEFPVTYIDPWGGRYLQGTIAAPPLEFPPTTNGGALFDPTVGPTAARTIFPDTRVGMNKVKRGEDSIVILAGLTGIF